MLPTGVRTGLPFAINAPFVQDPARLQIKEPARSPTNRWLLDRIGRLAARAMLAWLENRALAIGERAAAYGLMPPRAGSEGALAQEVEALVERAFAAEIRGRAVVLTAAGDLVEPRQAIAVNSALFDVWDEGEIAEIFADRTFRVVSPNVARDHVDRLAARGLVERRTRRNLVDRLRVLRPPRPGSFAGLYALWTYVLPELARALWWGASEVALLPLQGSTRLQKASSCVRFRRSRALDEDDAEFLLARLEVCDQEWFDFLQALTNEKQRRFSRDEPAPLIGQFLSETGLDRPSSPERLIGAVVDRLKPSSTHDVVRLARIAAKLDVSVPADFPYVTVGGTVRRASEGVVYDPEGELEELLPETFVLARLLHPMYERDLTAREACIWRGWAIGTKSRLLRFPLPEAVWRPLGRREFQRMLHQRGVDVQPKYPYASDIVYIADPDFPSELWAHWGRLAKDDPAIWARVFEGLLNEVDRLEERMCLRACQRGSRYTRTVELPGCVPAAWIVRFRGERCLWADDRTHRHPEELYRRTTETEGLLGIERFVARGLDGEKTAPILDLLGVMAEPQDLSRILQRLRWAVRQRPEDLESIGKLYRALEIALDGAAQTRIAEVREIFATTSLAICADGIPRPTLGLFVANPEGVPGVATLHPRFAHMRLWALLDIPRRPTAEFVLDWLRTFEPGHCFTGDDLLRMREVLAHYPDEVWERVGCWLDVGGGWRSIEDFAYFVERDDPYDPSLLFADVRKQTADVRGLPERFVAGRVASRLSSLAETLELRPGADLERLRRQQPPGWLQVWAWNVARIDFDEAEATERARRLAARLATADWVFVRELRLVPHLEGRPVGEPVRDPRVAFCGNEILFEDASEVRCARLLADEIMRQTESPDLGHSLVFSYERPPEVIDRYFHENFSIREDMQDEASGAGAWHARTGEIAVIEPVPAATRASAEGAEGSGSAEDRRPVAATVRDEVRGGREQTARRERTSEDEQLIRELAEHLELRGHHGIYVGGDGRVLRRSETSRSLWELWAPDGTLWAVYWVRRHCLDRQPLEVPAEIWERVRENPRVMTFVLLNAVGQLRLLTGEQLLQALDTGRMELFPATYRLRQRR